MGFGWLFVGYIITANIIFKKYTDVFAYLIMLGAVSKLAPYGRYFKMTKTLLYGMIAIAAGWFVFSITALFGGIDDSVVVTVEYYLEFLSSAYYAFFNYALFTGIYEIAEETDIPVISARAKRQRAFTLGFDIIYVVLAATPFFAIAAPCLVVVWIVLTCFNSSVIYSCYMWITLEGEDSMERKPSRFAFVNKIADALDRFEESVAQRRGEEENEKLRRKIEKNRSKKRK